MATALTYVCPACFKSIHRAHMARHVLGSPHSVHQPQCGVCGKHCTSFESVREHLHVSDLDHLSPTPFKGTCQEKFAKGGCRLCLRYYEDAAALAEHINQCRLSAPPMVPAPCGLNPCASALAIKWLMVGGGDDATVDLCAAVCLVDQDENMIFSTFVKPQFTVTHLREEVNGLLTEEDLEQGMPLKDVQAKVSQILQGLEGCLLVGHDLIHVMARLELEYPTSLLRDTAKYKPLMKTNFVSHSLNYLTRSYLGYEIESGKHSLYQGAVSVMRLYKRIRDRGLTSCTKNENASEPLKRCYRVCVCKYECWCLDIDRDED